MNPSTMQYGPQHNETGQDWFSTFISLLESFDDYSFSTKISILFGTIWAIVMARFMFEGVQKEKINAPECFSQSEYRPFKLKKKEFLFPQDKVLKSPKSSPKDRSHDKIAQYKLFHFEVPKNSEYNLPVGQTLSVRAVVDHVIIERCMTPINTNEEVETDKHFTFVLRTEQNGVMSKHIDSMVIGTIIDIKGPTGDFIYQPNKYKTLLILAGGYTGLAMTYRLIQTVLRNKNDTTQVKLIYANVKQEETLYFDQLTSLEASNPEKFKVYHVLVNPPPNWNQGVGFITPDLTQKVMGDRQGCFTLIAGPPVFRNTMVIDLESVGFTDEDYHAYL